MPETSRLRRMPAVAERPRGRREGFDENAFEKVHRQHRCRGQVADDRTHGGGRCHRRAGARLVGNGWLNPLRIGEDASVYPRLPGNPVGARRHGPGARRMTQEVGPPGGRSGHRATGPRAVGSKAQVIEIGMACYQASTGDQSRSYRKVLPLPVSLARPTQLPSGVYHRVMSTPSALSR